MNKSPTNASKYARTARSIANRYALCSRFMHGVRLQAGRARMLKAFDTVRVARLDQADRAFRGTDGVCRAPRIGDVGAICHEYEPDNARAPVAVESVDAMGKTIWLADFSREELELVAASARKA